jgi:hypothetical protein
MRKPAAYFVLFLLLAVLLSSCQSFGQGPISEPIVGIGAALLTALDQLLASKVLTPEQYLPLATGVKGISATIATAMDTVQKVQQQVDADRAACWTPTEKAGAVGGIITAAAGVATKLTQVLRDRNYTPEEIAERKIKRIRAKAKVS